MSLRISKGDSGLQKFTYSPSSTDHSKSTDLSKFIGPSKPTGLSTSPISDRFTGFITSREASEVQGVE
ncbi:hypothetical protein NG798_24625, partial [Ancylothrix sp. C2]|uniref:hypothetical protein n=1 Tax=Ancylothrix sp. D3o TaxID=2953691 RepID=UPI0021BAF160